MRLVELLVASTVLAVASTSSLQLAATSAKRIARTAPLPPDRKSTRLNSSHRT